MLAAARTAGQTAARHAAAWWAQDTVGGRSTGGVAATAQRVLTGIDDGDPAVLDALPTCDLPATPETEPDFYPEIAPVDAAAWCDLTDDGRLRLLDAYRDGFTTELPDRVAAECRSVLGDTRPRHAKHRTARTGVPEVRPGPGMRIIPAAGPEPACTADDRAYLDAVAVRGFGALTQHLKRVCPECGVEPAGTDEASAHALTEDGHVVIGCEGYWVIDPAAVGLDPGGWKPPVPGPQ